jgi:hypothetical protein
VTSKFKLDPQESDAQVNDQRALTRASSRRFDETEREIRYLSTVKSGNFDRFTVEIIFFLKIL